MMAKALMRSIGILAVALMSQVANASMIWAGNGHEYEVVSAGEVEFTWTAARAAAQALGPGWDLASVTSSEENIFLINFLLPVNPNSRAHYWIGATDSSVENTFVWVDGDPFSYTNWWGGEPNNQNNEDFVAYDFRASWAWNDAPDDVNALFPTIVTGYVAERIAVAEVPEPGTLALLALGILALGLGAAGRQGR